MENIPLINISGLETLVGVQRHDLINSLAQAFHEIGFVAVQGHGIDRSLISEMRLQTKDLFNRPLSEKMTLKVQADNYRGFIPLGFFTPNGQQDFADQYEAYKLHSETPIDDPILGECSLYGENRWPDNSIELQKAVAAYWQKCEGLSQLLLTAISEHLGLSATHFESAFEKPLNNMTLLHYPPAHGDQGQFGIHPHKDTDVLTILAPDQVGGLFVRHRSTEHWIEVDTPNDALIVNIGDMLEIWSGGYFVSTPHKVINQSENHRYSFPFFAVPRYDTLIESQVSNLIEQQNSFVRRSMHSGDISAKIWFSNWPQSTAIDGVYDPYIE